MLGGDVQRLYQRQLLAPRQLVVADQELERLQEACKDRQGSGERGERMSNNPTSASYSQQQLEGVRTSKWQERLGDVRSEPFSPATIRQEEAPRAAGRRRQQHNHTAAASRLAS